MEMSDQTTCLDPSIESFERSLSSRNYKPATLKTIATCFDDSEHC